MDFARLSLSFFSCCCCCYCYSFKSYIRSCYFVLILLVAVSWLAPQPNAFLTLPMKASMTKMTGLRHYFPQRSAIITSNSWRRTRRRRRNRTRPRQALFEFQATASSIPHCHPSSDDHAEKNHTSSRTPDSGGGLKDSSAIRSQDRYSSVEAHRIPPLNTFSTDSSNTNTLAAPTTSATRSSETGMASSTSRTISSLSNVPSYRQLLTFASTTILIWLSEPLLSLVDTTVIGLTVRHDAVTQLASLAPATTLMDSLIYLTFFLAMATTNLIARQLAIQDYRQLQLTTSHVLGVSVALGIFITLIVYTAGPTLLAHMSGAVATPTLVGWSLQYCRIRALTAAASVVGMTAQSFCLAVLDIATPLKAVAVASIINLIGDLWLSPRFGVAGAAAATAAATSGSCLVLCQAVYRKMQEWRHLEEEWRRLEETEIAIRQAETDKYDATGGDSGDINTNTLSSTLLPPLPHIPFMSLPQKRAFLKLVAVSGPIFLVLLAQIAVLGAMTVTATHFGVVTLAAHNILNRVFLFFACFGDSLSQSALTFLPATLYPKPNRSESRAILSRLLVLGCTVGLAGSQLTKYLLKHFARFMAKDIGIIQMLQTHPRWMDAALCLHPFIMLSEGTVMARRDWGCLLRTYAMTLAVHFALLQTTVRTFDHIWRVFFCFQLIRLVNFGSHVWTKQSVRQQQTN